MGIWGGSRSWIEGLRESEVFVPAHAREWHR